MRHDEAFFEESERQIKGKENPVPGVVRTPEPGWCFQLMKRKGENHLVGVASKTSTWKGANVILTGFPACTSSAGRLSPFGELSL